MLAGRGENKVKIGRLMCVALVDGWRQESCVTRVSCVLTFRVSGVMCVYLPIVSFDVGAFALGSLRQA